ncbi:tripartite motif-containing protein 16-like [Scomber japonicus]|uniref:tripartite motif-containing protein 16-like n=1 Tax=Scomber japonicus TaxID=13676 RepID=UPI002305CC78|nr:tripartite motif-containing protein 16-like [Scomber japonicus]
MRIRGKSTAVLSADRPSDGDLSWRKTPSVKSCLQRLVSHCDQHLQPHYESPAFEKHKLVNPSKKLQENICSHHGKILKIFCHSDQQRICYLCCKYEHKGHDTVLASEEKTKRQGELRMSRQKIQQRILDIEKYVKMLQQEVETIIRTGDNAVKDNEKIFNELIRLIKNESLDVKQQIRSRQETGISRIEELLEKLQQELVKLRKKDTKLEQLSQTEDQSLFLHNYSSLSQLTEFKDFPSIKTPPLKYFEDVTAVVSGIKDKLQEITGEAWTKISLVLNEVDVLLPQEPKTRAQFLQYTHQNTLDPNTANAWLLLSEDNRTATVATEKQLYSTHQDRFIDMFQVMGREGLSGRHYWEVEKNRDEVSIAVAYKDISRTGYESGFGNDDKSWALECFDQHYEFRHNSVTTFISGPLSSRLGVYLDHSAGILSFYSVSDIMTLLHRVQTLFTQPLYQGIGIFGSGGHGSAAELCKLE